MSNPPQQDDSTPVTNPPRDGNESQRPDAAGADSSARWSRRRFGKAALVATPVLATLYGRPLHAAANCSPSGWVSGNTSLHHDLEDCGGFTPGFWQSDNSKRESQYPGWGRIFQDALNSASGFSGIGTYYVPEKDEDDDDDEGFSGTRIATLQDAVDKSVTILDTDSLLRQILRFGTAALLNARFVPGYSLSEDQVIEIVGMTVTSSDGGYTTPGGDYLTRAQVKAFLENTMDVPSWGPGTTD